MLIFHIIKVCSDKKIWKNGILLYFKVCVALLSANFKTKKQHLTLIISKIIDVTEISFDWS